MALIQSPRKRGRFRVSTPATGGCTEISGTGIAVSCIVVWANVLVLLAMTFCCAGCGRPTPPPKSMVQTNAKSQTVNDVILAVTVPTAVTVGNRVKVDITITNNSPANVFFVPSTDGYSELGMVLRDSDGNWWPHVTEFGRSVIARADEIDAEPIFAEDDEFRQIYHGSEEMWTIYLDECYKLDHPAALSLSISMYFKEQDGKRFTIHVTDIKFEVVEGSDGGAAG